MKTTRSPSKFIPLNTLISIRDDNYIGKGGTEYASGEVDQEISARMDTKIVDGEAPTQSDSLRVSHVGFESKSTNSVYTAVFKSITDKLEQGIAPWSKPWQGGSMSDAFNPFTGTVYSGSNQGLLFCDQISNQRTSNKYATFKQWAEKKRYVKKGEKGIPIVYWNKGEDKNDENKSYMFVRYYSVFNESQLSDYVAPEIQPIEFNGIEAAQNIIKQSPLSSLRLVHDKQSAFYVPSLDYINMPKPETFTSVDAYYSTLFHEYGHATGHESRLKRDMGGMFGNHSYSREELIAELTSAILCAKSGIQNQVDQSAAYCKSWLKKFNDHPKEMLSAFSQASKACDYILNIDRSKKVEVESEAS